MRSGLLIRNVKLSSLLMIRQLMVRYVVAY